MFMHTVGTRLW